MINTNTNRIFPTTRWLAALIIPFLVVAFLILYIVPHQTQRLFAWHIQPSMSAMMLGAAYAGGIYFFSAVLRSRKWHTVKVGFLPVITFASLLGLATILHWDRFNHQHVSFFAWAALYFTTPALVLSVWFHNRQQDTGIIAADDVVMPLGIRLVMAAIGILTLGISLMLFFNPAIMIKLWCWTLTPLTARVMGAMFALPGVVGLGIAFDSRWSAAETILSSQGFSIVLILIAMIRARREVDWSNPTSWLFAGGLAIIALSIGMLILTMRSQRSKNTRVSNQRT